MDTIKDTRHSQRGGPIVTEVSVPSFSLEGVSYSVRLYHKDGAELGFSCNCRAATHGKGCRKHGPLGFALARIRLLPFSRAQRERIEGRVTDLAKRIYAKPRKTETAGESYDLMLEAYGERYASLRMRDDARARHSVVSSRCFGEAS